MKIHKAILIKPSDKFVVRVWDSPEPMMEKFTVYDYKVWQQSYKEYEVHPDYLFVFFKLAIDEIKIKSLFNKHIVNGIDLDPDLIELTDSYAILKDKPIESEVENIDGLWYDAWRLAQGKDCLDYIMELKEKYTLKRK